MDADARTEANRRLAEKLGWTDIRRERHYAHTGDMTSSAVQFTDNGPFTGVPPSGGEKRHLPDFYGSVDACLAQLPDNVHVDMFREVAGAYSCQVWRFEGDFLAEWEGGGATRPEALAAALLAWTETTKVQP